MENEVDGLDKRKAYILATVVYEYIATGEPVGSQALTQKYNLGVSSATVRNEMADLEAGGYLEQPHTSAGRVPSDAGYRTYVDALMSPEELGAEERRRIRDEMRDARAQLDEIVEQSSRLLGRLAGNLAFVTKPQSETQSFRYVQLIWIGERSGIAIIVTSFGVASQSLFELRNDVTPDDLTRLSNALNANFAGRLLRDCDERSLAMVTKQCGFGDDMVGAVRTAFAGARTQEQPGVAASGAQHLLDQPEFRDVRKLRSILRILEEQRTLYDLVADAFDNPAASVKIGHELGSEELADLSLVTVPYRFGERAVGMLSILGPRRMPYARLLALASGTAETLSERLHDVEVK